jgi:hypothetical protein
MSTGDITMPKSSTRGIRVDNVTPTFPWRDLLGNIRPDPSGVNAPSLTAFRGGSCRAYAFSAGDKIDCEFHVPHDWAFGTDLFIHAHWFHNGTAISGSNVMTLAYTYAKGHNQAAFSAEKSQAITVSTPDIATIPQWRHRLEEIQLSNSGGSGNYLDTTAIEVDGVIAVNLTQTTIPTISGGTSNEPFVLFVDLHYQSSGIGTKQRAPDFYT